MRGWDPKFESKSVCAQGEAVSLGRGRKSAENPQHYDVNSAKVMCLTARCGLSLKLRVKSLV